MDALLISFVNALNTITRLEEKNIGIHVPVKRTNSILGLTVQIIVSQTEPSDMANVPENLLWACFDKSSPMYRKMYRRTSKTANPSMGTEHTWVLVTTLEGVWEKQYYAEGEEPTYSNPIATTTVRGIMTISGVAADPDHPVVVVSNDPRNNDKRNPKPHDSMHPNKPAQQLLSDHTTIDIIPNEPVEGSVIYGSSSGPVLFYKMGKSDVCAIPPIDIDIQDPATLSEAPYTGMIVFGTTLAEKLDGIPVGTEMHPSVQVYGAGVDSRGFRKFLGIFSPSLITQNGNAVSSVNIVEGQNNITVTITASGFPSLVLSESFQGVGA